MTERPYTDVAVIMRCERIDNRWQLRRGGAQGQTQDLGAPGSPAEAQSEGRAEAENQTETPKVDKP